MILFFRRTFRDIRANFFLNLVTVITMAMAVLIFSAFLLFVINAEAIVRTWMGDLRIMAYLKPDLTPTDISDTRRQITEIPHVRTAQFVSRDEALERFRQQLGPQASLVNNLKENPLPDAFEIGLAPSPRMWMQIEPVAERVGTLARVVSVEYGQQWIGRVISVLNLVRLAGYALGGLFFMGAVFFVANTIRLVLYSRREEIEIMRLVGASEGFIRDPLYLQCLILGAVGSLMGLGALFGLFRLLVTEMNTDPAAAILFFEFRFLPVRMVWGVLTGSMFVGWLGCFISLRQFLKR